VAGHHSVDAHAKTLPRIRCSDSKRLFGGQLWAQNLATQRTEALVKCAVLNRMTQLGMPQTVRV
jgi:hypothetical protein